MAESATECRGKGSMSKIALNYVHGAFNKHPKHDIKVDPNTVAKIWETSVNDVKYWFMVSVRLSKLRTC